MPQVVTRTQGDNRPPLDWTFTHQGAVRDLSGAASVEFRMVFGGVRVRGTAQVLDAPSGRVRYSWGPTDLSTPGTYTAAFVASFPDGQETSDRFTVVVLPAV